MRLDVGAIGKGYAASEALAVLTARGFGSALVAVSGDLAFSGAPPGARGWRVQLHSVDLAPEVPAVVELTNAAVSTAGASEQHLDAGGRRYSHIVDPATRTALTDDITVTVVAKHGLDADGLDTAVSVLGVEKGLALIESRPDAAALIVRRTPRGREAGDLVALSRACDPGSATAKAEGIRQKGEFGPWASAAVYRRTDSRNSRTASITGSCHSWPPSTSSGSSATPRARRAAVSPRISAANTTRPDCRGSSARAETSTSGSCSSSGGTSPPTAMTPAARRGPRQAAR